MAVNLVNLEAVTVAHGTRLLMDGVSLGVSEGDRVGIVGRNGGGKTTLLKTLVKAEQPHSGRVTHTSGLRVGVLTQDVRIDPASTVHAAVLGDAAEHALDVAVALTASGVAAGVRRATGPVAGARIVEPVRS